MRITLRQIAEKSGFSLQTVSQILNGKGEAFRGETCESVVTIARELGYRPNSSARAMRSGKFGAISLLLSTVSERSLLPSELLDGILDRTVQEDINLNIARLPDETLSSPEALPLALRELLVDGLLIKYDAEIPQPMISLLQKSGLPVIWINSRHDSDCIFPDDFEGARQATEHLLTLGHRRIAFVDWLGSSHYSYAERCRGYEAAMRGAGLATRYIRDWPEIAEVEKMRSACQWLLEPERPTAVISYSNWIALPLLYAAALLGIKVPRDLSLITFNDQEMTQLGVAPTTMLLPQREIGRQAVQMLLEKQDSPEQSLPPRPISMRLCAGQTCAPPSESIL